MVRRSPRRRADEAVLLQSLRWPVGYILRLSTSGGAAGGYHRGMSDVDAPLPVAVVGVGRMGGHHARTYAAMTGATLVGVVDPDVERAGAVASQHGAGAYADSEALLAAHPELRAVTVAAPTVHHAAAARPLLERGIACLIEKPLAPDAATARELADLAAEHGAVLQVGHTERFNPAVQAVAGMGLVPRFIEVDRVSPMSFRSLDVGVVMDLMIHDLDIVLMLVGERPERVEAVGVAVVADHEDVCSARLTFPSGCVADITASRLALKTERKLRLFSEGGYVNLDYQKRTGIVIRKSANEETLAKVRAEIAAGKDLTDLDYPDLVRVDELTMEAKEGHDPLTAELTAFLHAVRTGATPVVDAEAGHAAVETARRVVDAVRAHRWRDLEGAAIA